MKYEVKEDVVCMVVSTAENLLMEELSEQLGLFVPHIGKWGNGCGFGLLGGSVNAAVATPCIL